MIYERSVIYMKILIAIAAFTLVALILSIPVAPAISEPLKLTTQEWNSIDLSGFSVK